MSYDITLDGKGYMLARREQLGRGGRAWNVQPLAGSRARRSDAETQYGNLPAHVESPMVWTSGHLGYGDDQMLMPHRYHYSENIDARFPNQVINGPQITTLDVPWATGATPDTPVNITAFIEYHDRFYFAAGQYVFDINPTTYVITKRCDLGAGEVAVDMIAFDDKLYVSLGYSTHMFSCDSTHTWVQSADTSRGYFAISQERLYASDSTSSLRFCARGSDPAVDTNWSAVYNIGDSGSEITSLSALGELVYVGKSDGLHVLDASFISPMVTPELRPYANEDNCVNLTPWHGMLWVPHLRGLLAYRDMGMQGFMIRSAGPGRGASHNNPAQGQVTALAGDDEWLYLALYTGTDSYLLAGREVRGNESGIGGMIWHPLAKIEDARCDALFISQFWDNPTLWVGIGSDVGYIILPAGSSNPLRDANCTYAQAGSYYLPAHNWYAPTATKVWKSIEIEAENLSYVNYIDVYYRIDDVDDTTPWTKHSDRANRSPVHVLAFPSGGISGQKIEVRLDFVAGNATEPIRLRSVVLLGAERPEPLTRIMATIRCADRLPTREGRPSHRMAESIMSDLRALAAQPYAVQLQDPAGTTRWVLVQPGIAEQEADQQGELSRELLLQVEMTAFEATSSVPVTGHFAVYGASTYGGGHVFR